MRYIVVLLVPLVNGSSLLTLKDGSTYCTGNLTDLEIMSVSCSDSVNGCTWGSAVSVFAQGTPPSHLNFGNPIFSQSIAYFDQLTPQVTSHIKLVPSLRPVCLVSMVLEGGTR